MNFRDPMCPLPLQPCTTGKSPWITTHPCYPYLLYPMLLCLQDTPRYSSIFWKSSAAYCLGGSSYLFALWLTPYVRVFFIDIPCPCHTGDMEIIMCVNAPYHPLIPMKSFFWLRCHSGLELELKKNSNLR